MYAICMSFIFFILLSSRWREETSGGIVKEENQSVVVVKGIVYRNTMLEKNQAIYIKNAIIQEPTNQDITILNSKSSNQANLPFYSEQMQRKNQKILKLKSSMIIYMIEPVEVKLGQTIIVKGTLMIPRTPGNPGEFNQRAYYLGENIQYILKKGVLKEICGKDSIYLEKLERFRMKLEGSIERGIRNPKEVGVFQAIFLGNKRNLEDEVKELYQVGGVAHILAISGMHITLLGFTIHKGMRKIGITPILASCFSSIILVTYGIMTGLGTSTKRALFMFLLYLYSEVVQRTYDMRSALAFSGLVILLENPYQLYQASFLLSFAAMLGIIYLYPMVCELFRIKRKISKSIGVTFSITLATLPITLYFFYEIPLYTIIINIIFLPLVGLMMMSGIIGSFVGLLCEKGGKIFMTPCDYILEFFRKILQVVIKLPKSVLIVGQPQLWQIYSYYALLLLFSIVYYFLKKYKEIDRKKEDHQTRKS